MHHNSDRGMPYQDAVTALKNQSNDNIDINTRFAPNGSIHIFVKDKTGRDYLSYLAGYDSIDGFLAMDDSGAVTYISFMTRLVNALFNAYDVTTPDFIKAFGDNYGMTGWRQQIEKSDLSDISPEINTTLTREVWTFQEDGFSVKVSRTIPGPPSLPGYYNQYLKDLRESQEAQANRNFARQKDLNIEILKSKKPEARQMTFD